MYSNSHSLGILQVLEDDRSVCEKVSHSGIQWQSFLAKKDWVA
jgi:hypothetical protein